MSEPTTKTSAQQKTAAAPASKTVTVAKGTAAAPAKPAALPPKVEAKKPERKAAHTAKIDKAQAMLQPLDEKSRTLFEEAAAHLSAGKLNILASHIVLESRRKSTGLVPQHDFAVGDRVKILNAQHPKFVGKIGVIDESRKIRAFVEFEGTTERAYVLKADLELVSAAKQTLEVRAEAPTREIELASETAQAAAGGDQ